MWAMKTPQKSRPLSHRQRQLLDELLRRQRQQREWGTTAELADAIGLGAANRSLVVRMLVTLEQRGCIVQGSRCVTVHGPVAVPASAANRVARRAREATP